MNSALIRLSRGAAGLAAFAGPIFDKELRVSSRRRRNYVLRFVYLAALTLLIALMWASLVRSSYGSSLYSASRMSEAGKGIVLCITWFQFIAAQLIAVVLMSTAISDEIVHRTLGVLMTTPVSSFQIVLGKLLSKMLQLVLLLAISFPLLAVVRVFGGVPWDYVLSSLSITLVSALFAGSVSMFFSIRNRRAYSVILKTLFVGFALYALLPWMAVMVLKDMRSVSGASVPYLFTVFMYANPFAAMSYLTSAMMMPRFAGASFGYFWPVACAIGLGVSLLLLTLVTVTVRKVALRQATGEAGTFRSRRKLRKAGETPKPVREGKIRRVRGPAFIWKELRAPLVRSRTRTIVGLVLLLGVLGITYLLCGRDLAGSSAQVAYGVIFVILAALCTAVLSATAITTEKEAQTWPILLLTPLSDWQILVGKAVGIFRRTLPAWLLLFGHVAVFCCAGCIHWVALPLLAMLTAWVVLFLTCSGLYFSSCYKRTTTAVIVNLGLAVVLWIVAPFVIGMAENTGSGGMTFFKGFVSGNPVVQAVVVLEGTAGTQYDGWRGGIDGARAGHRLSQLRFDWPSDSNARFGETTGIIFAWAVGYMVLGSTLAGLAWSRLRRKVF
jgi:ABC-type transport system involved in multi-copper enzyme maturation permease subunit